MEAEATRMNRGAVVMKFKRLEQRETSLLQKVLQRLLAPGPDGALSVALPRSFFALSGLILWFTSGAFR